MSTKNSYLDEFVTKLIEINDVSELTSFLHAILTPSELEEIPKRLQIVKMLKQNIPQREISKKLGVGIATVTRGSREISKGNFKNI